MDFRAKEQRKAVGSPLWKRVTGLLPGLIRRGGPRARLCLDEMSDRVKRDIGFLDGREPRHEEALRR